MAQRHSRPVEQGTCGELDSAPLWSLAPLDESATGALALDASNCSGQQRSALDVSAPLPERRAQPTTPRRASHHGTRPTQRSMPLLPLRHRRLPSLHGHAELTCLWGRGAVVSTCMQGRPSGGHAELTYRHARSDAPHRAPKRHPRRPEPPDEAAS